MRIGAIGVTLHDLPTVVSADAARGPDLRRRGRRDRPGVRRAHRQGVTAQVVLMHQGDEGALSPDACPTRIPRGPASVYRRARLTPQVDVFFTGYSHQQYVCSDRSGRRPGRRPGPVLRTAALGRRPDARERRGRARPHHRRNEIVTRDVAPDPATAAIASKAVAEGRARRPGGRRLDHAGPGAGGGTAGESPLGDVIADAQLAATRGAGAQVALTNPGGIRADLPFAPRRG